MLSSKERIVSILICILLAIIIKLNFFSSNESTQINQTNKGKDKDIKNNNKPPYYNEQISLLNSKIPNTVNYKVINIFQRKNPTVYTQGLFYHNTVSP